MADLNSLREMLFYLLMSIQAKKSSSTLGMSLGCIFLNDGKYSVIKILMTGAILSNSTEFSLSSSASLYNLQISLSKVS